MWLVFVISWGDLVSWVRGGWVAFGCFCFFWVFLDCCNYCLGFYLVLWGAF